jgi:hypothetical protein
MFNVVVLAAGSGGNTAAIPRQAVGEVSCGRRGALRGRVWLLRRTRCQAAALVVVVSGAGDSGLPPDHCRRRHTTIVTEALEGCQGASALAAAALLAGRSHARAGVSVGTEGI